MNAADLVTIASFPFANEAEMLKSALEAAGVECVLSNAETNRILFHTLTGAVELRVRAEDVERANEIVRSAAEVVDEDPPPVGADAAICPSCGSPELSRVNKLPYFAVIAVSMAGAGFAIERSDLAFLAIVITAIVFLLMPRNRCVACGARFE